MKSFDNPAKYRPFFILAALVFIAVIYRFPEIKYRAESAVFFTADPLLRIFFHSAVGRPSLEIVQKISNAKALTLSASGIYAPVIKVPPVISFGSILIAAGLREGVNAKMKAVLDGGIFVGFVEEVFDNYSRIRMISSFGNYEQIRLDEISQVSAEGLGGMLAKIELPKAVSLSVGDPVFIYADDLYLAGFIESVDLDDAKSLAEAKIILPFNIYELKYVLLVP